MSAAASPVFRETFLRERFNPDRRETVRLYGEILEQLTSEAGTMLPRGGLREELSAIAVDLDYAAELLEENATDQGESYLMLRSATLAKAVRGLAENIRRDLAEAKPE